MRVFGKQVFVFVASCFSVTAIAAEFDGSEPLLCSFAHIIECDLGFGVSTGDKRQCGCAGIRQVGFQKEEVVAISAGVETAPDDIDFVINLANYVVAQGVQGGAEGTADSLAWSATISHATGQIDGGSGWRKCRVRHLRGMYGQFEIEKIKIRLGCCLSLSCHSHLIVPPQVRRKKISSSSCLRSLSARCSSSLRCRIRTSNASCLLLRHW